MLKATPRHTQSWVKPSAQPGYPRYRYSTVIISLILSFSLLHKFMLRCCLRHARDAGGLLFQGLTLPAVACGIRQ
jgi:hypothetical protein